MDGRLRFVIGNNNTVVLFMTRVSFLVAAILNVKLTVHWSETFLQNIYMRAIEAQSDLNRSAVTRIAKFSQDLFHFCLIAARASVALVN